jgi:hypothetical protein
MSDIKLIAILLMLAAAVMYFDDGAAQRWCDTYKLCGEQND